MRTATATWARRMSKRQVKYCRERKRQWIQISQTNVHAHHICQSHICTAHMCNRNATAGSVQSIRVMWHETAQHSKFTHESRSSFCTSSLHEEKNMWFTKQKNATNLGEVVKTVLNIGVFLSYQSKQTADFIDGPQTAQKSQKHGEWSHGNQNIRDHLQDHGWILC